ncbi:hypothetical protein QZH56_37185 (plasmid) [Streptomyces olivoreticuli]|uniref:hypothetical protein n=1 Tax=Streptomyces olivoreticuli TaxID=68246 RepID=UPI0026583CDF|nr:hypothetical protein [Streptomyces olivoreticuli]WKK27824.1 hypothetical protein QZH56_37185 [Streptomyces olivoreticuli]
MTTAPFVTWHRTEYEGREDELVNQNEIAALANVTRAAVSNWATRHDNFPEVVAVHGTAQHAPRLYARAEIETWLADRATQPRKKPTSRAPARSRQQILTGRADRAARQVETEQQRIAELYLELGKAAHRLSTAEGKLRAARQELAALDAPPQAASA